MHLVFEPVRLTRFVVLAVAGAAALSVSACSSSHDQKSPAASSPAAAKGKTETAIQGVIASVSGDEVKVTQTNGTATVNVSPSTKVIDFTRIGLTDVAAGACVNVFAAPAPPPGGGVMANAVQLVPPRQSDGKCGQPKPVPEKVTGTVASVAGNTINVTVTDANGNPAPTAVTVTDATGYSRGTPATSQAIVEGKCATAHGTKDGGGKLQATLVSVGPTRDGKCS